MSYDSNQPIDDTVTSIMEFGIGAILRWIFIIVAIGVVVLAAFGSTETSAEALTIGLVVVAGLIVGGLIIPIIFLG